MEEVLTCKCGEQAWSLCVNRLTCITCGYTIWFNSSNIKINITELNSKLRD